MRKTCVLLGLLVAAICAEGARGDTLAEIKERGTLVWGADAEGGGPYVYPDPANPRAMIGFEAELAGALAGELGVKAQFFQGPWHELPALLGTKQIDVVLNGYELTPSRAARMGHTRPYYIYQLVLLGRRGNPRLASWEDLDERREGRSKWQIGVLQSSAAQFYLEEHFPQTVDVRLYEGTTDSMREVENDKLDAVLVDLPAAVFYAERFAKLEPIGAPVNGGYYVMLVRKDDTALRDALDAAIDKLLADGRLEAIYRRYGLWNDLQDALVSLGGKSDEALGIRAEKLSGWAVIKSRGWLLVAAAGVTVLLACASMPLAMALGLAVALARMYGPAPLRWLAIG
jgi:polar amino acid transport system permease protein/polar amino acid transport system substrate-binding protein